MRSEYMLAIEEGGATGEFIENLGHASTHFVFVFKPFLSLFHLSPQIGSGIEPIARRLLRFVAGGVQVVQLIRQPVQGIRIKRGSLPRLETSQQHSRTIKSSNTLPCGHGGWRTAEEHGSRYPSGGLHGSKSGFFRF